MACLASSGFEIVSQDKVLVYRRYLYGASGQISTQVVTWSSVKSSILDPDIFYEHGKLYHNNFISFVSKA